MSTRGSLDGDYFLRPVRFFTIVDIHCVLGGVISEPFATSVATGYITQAIGSISG
jgi:hypothetical protein